MNAPTPELDFGFHVPAGRETFRTWEVARIINHSRKQVEALVELGKFGKCVNCGVGTKKSWTIPRAGLIAFLRKNAK